MTNPRPLTDPGLLTDSGPLTASGLLTKKSFSLSGHRTSVALEPAFWSVLGDMAQARALSLGALVAEIDSGRQPGENLASRLRVAALRAALTLAQ